ncbi:hypothetical protein ACQ4PT_022164 [Festuca glaucescens]
MEAAVVAASAAAAAAKDAALAASVAAAAAAKDAAMAAATAREAMDAVKDAAAAMSAAALHAKEAAVTASAAALNAKDAAAVAATAGEAATVAAAVQASKKRKFHLVDDQDPQGSGNFNDGDFISRLPAKELSVTAPSASLNPKEAAVAALTAALNGKEAAAVAATAGEAAAALQASNKRKFHLIDDENPLGSGNTNDGDFISRLPTVTASSAALNAKEAAMPALAPALNEKEAAAVVSTAVEAAAALQASKKPVSTILKKVATGVECWFAKMPAFLSFQMHHQTMDPDLDNFVGTQTCCDPQRVPDSVMLGSHPISSHLVLRLNCRNANAGRDWPILPKDLIDDVAGRLLRYDVAEHLRLRAACKEWRACTADPRTGGDLDSRFRPRNWIMLSSSPKGARRQFINTSTGACALVDLPELSGHRLETYTEGLLLLRDEASDGVRLLNPLTRALTDLPPVTAELGSMHVAWKTPNPSLPRFVYAGISDEPSPATVVLFMQGAMCSIAFAKPGDERWALMDKECWKSLPTRWSGGSDRSKLLDRMPYVSVLTTWGSIYLPTMDGNIVKVSIHPEPRLVPVVANHPFDLLPSNVVSYLVPADDHR